VSLTIAQAQGLVAKVPIFIAAVQQWLMRVDQSLQARVESPPRSRKWQLYLGASDRKCDNGYRGGGIECRDRLQVLADSRYRDRGSVRHSGGWNVDRARLPRCSARRRRLDNPLDNILCRKFMGDSVGVSRNGVMSAVFADGELLGIPGLLLGIPAAL